jgi:hypothetical protein
MLFNSAYALALAALHGELETEGIVLKLAYRAGPFWGDVREMDDSSEEQNVLDATFVDVECLILTAKSPKLLLKAVRIALRVLTKVFKCYRLDINWNPGKTEGLLRLRGKHAAELLDSLRNSEGNLQIAVPGTANVLHIVTQYKHLGSMTAVDGSSMPYVLSRASSATSAYVPLVGKLFGSKCLYLSLKLNYFQSLILSKLLFNNHVRVLSVREVAFLNTLFMRVLRRVADAMRFGPGCGSDRAVRERLGYPSIDCVLQRRRLLYAARLVRAGPKALLALLSVRDSNGEPAMPWTKQLRGDLDVLYRTVPGVREILPEPTDAKRWFDFWVAQPFQWEKLVSLLCYSDSVCDPVACVVPSADKTPLAVACEMCPAPCPAFKSQKALAQHQRVAHGLKSEARLYADGGGVCGSCGTCFHTRLRLLSHLSDKRRAKCLDWLKQNRPPLSAKRVDVLDEADRASRNEARKAGHTHAIARVSARTAQGKRIGYVTL